ncbi:Transcriptional regulator, AsnC family [Fulvivirga imtechensis AK7]|uniref:Transcriptional regulator, AsnC family n=1 Tax=Fulvivirga imtechensis AK7 TaxID=1237149 RepID=L8JUA0_9BACT|nr:Lrp/AsnC family transcriptional regulator [Fulvivirga imtechensis]ELR72350.1 Transcriptional regulator, AsnC family [Fulvivirga imtechensis AK7]
MEHLSFLKLDKIDFKLLNLLQHDAKMKHKELAAELGLTVTPVYERIKRLEKTGIIRKYVTLLDNNKVERELIAICMVKLEKHTLDNLKLFEEQTVKIPEVLECYHLAGEYDYMLKVVVKDMNAYQEFAVKKLSVIKNIATVQSSFAMSVLKDTTALVL